MKSIFVTLFPSLVEGYFKESILGRACDESYLEIITRNPRDYSTDKHGRVDDAIAGGGAGMVLSMQPLDALLGELSREFSSPKIIFVAPAGKTFTQNDSLRLSKEENLVFVCGRYEGIDERVIEKYAHEIFSIGDYVLTGGELPAMVMCDAIARHIPHVLGNQSSLEFESFNEPLVEAPTFGKPSCYEGVFVPSVLLKGNHSKISLFKRKLSLLKTKYFRPDLFEHYRIKDKK